jgi:hypothetical protein
VRYSLIVPYFRTPEITRLCLYSIWKFCRGEPEVIVVDNGPGSPESSVLKEFPKAVVVENPTPRRGSAANFEALDLGLARASHDLVGLLHSDTLFLREGWDLECFSRLEERRLAALGTFEREANPFRPLRQRVRDRFKHLVHRSNPGAASAGKLMLHFLLTRRSTLRQIGFAFLRDGHISPASFAGQARPVEVLSLVEVSRLIWHTSNITGLLTGQIDDPKLAATYRDKRARLLAHPRIREAFGPVLPKDA